MEKLKNYIKAIDVRNTDEKVTRLLGVSIDKKFIESIANIIGTDMRTYKVVKRGQFAYGPVTSRNGDKVSIALLEEDECIISSSYTVFQVTDNTKLLPEYLMLWFKRPEFDRYARFHSHGSAREIFDWDELCNVELPIPPIEEQQAIVKSYNDIENRIAVKRKINDNLTNQCITDYINLLNGFTIESHELPDGWSFGNIGNYCDIKSGYAFKSSWWTSCGCKVIKIANIVDNSVNLDICDYVSEEHAAKADNFFVKSGDLLIAMTGATTGKIGLVPLSNDKIVVNQRVGKFFLGNEPLNKAPFLFAMLLHDQVARQLQPDGTAGSAQDNLSADYIKSIAIILPTKSLIDTFNNQHKPHLISLMTNCKEISYLQNLQQKLLSNLSR